MKKLLFTFSLLLFSQFSFADTSYWVYYESISCYKHPPNSWNSWGGGDMGDNYKQYSPIEFVITKDSQFYLTFCEYCELFSSEYVLNNYNHNFIGDSVLELSKKEEVGLSFFTINTVFYFKKVDKKLDLSSMFRNNSNIFRNKDSFLFENINLLNLPDSLTKHLFYRLEHDTGNLYDVYEENKEGSRYSFKILFHYKDEKLYYEIIDIAPLYNGEFDCEYCTQEEAKEEIERTTKNRWKLLEN